MQVRNLQTTEAPHSHKVAENALKGKGTRVVSGHTVAADLPPACLCPSSLLSQTLCQAPPLYPKFELQSSRAKQVGWAPMAAVLTKAQ